MGKGGTGFTAVAKDSRVKQKGSYSKAELRKNMEQFMATGKHPELERVEGRDRGDHLWNVATLPERDKSRPHVYVEFGQDGTDVLGRLVFELFQDWVPKAVAWARSRIGGHSAAPLKGSAVHKLVQGYAMHFGAAKKGAPGLERTDKLRVTQEGVLCVSPQGDEFVVSFARQLYIDRDYQPFGRYVPEAGGGIQLLRRLEGLETDTKDVPLAGVRVTGCGTCNHLGDADEASPLTAGEAAAKAEELAEAKREEVREAVLAGLKRKEAASAGGGAGAAKRPRAMGGMMAQVMGGGASSDDSDSSSGGEGE